MSTTAEAKMFISKARRTFAQRRGVCMPLPSGRQRQRRHKRQREHERKVVYSDGANYLLPEREANAQNDFAFRNARARDEQH